MRIGRLLRAVVAAGASIAPVVYAQVRITPSPEPPSTIGNTGPHISGAIDDIVDNRSLRDRREMMRTTQRRERLIASANRLLEMTKQFQAEVSEHATLTADDEKKLDAIAKMAHEVRTRMTE